MANEIGTGNTTDVFQATIVTDRILQELRPYFVSRDHFRYQGPLPTNQYKFTRISSTDQGAGGATGVDDGGTGFVNTRPTTASATANLATIGTVGLMVTVTDEEAAISLMDSYSLWGDYCVRAVGHKFETDMTALLSGFTNSSGTSGTPLNYDIVIQGWSALVQRDVTGPVVGIFHPIQTGHLSRDRASSTATQYAGQKPGINDDGLGDLAGYWGDAANVRIFHTSVVPTMNTAVDRGGALFIDGESMGLYELWSPRVELQRDATVPGTKIVVTQRYGVVRIDAARGQTIVSRNAA